MSKSLSVKDLGSSQDEATPKALGHEADNLHQYAWYSICSMHQTIDPQCIACHSGNWVDEKDPEVLADRKLYEDDPDLWIDKHNPCECLTCSGYCVCGRPGHHRWEASRTPNSSNTASRFRQEEDTPEDAVCKLAIELFKQGELHV